MPSLILDTSTERGVVAIVHGEEVLFLAELPFGFQNSQFLLPAIHQGLKTNGLHLGGMDYVAVGVGPGSYTGIRVGATAAKALAFACQIPLIGICSLDGFVPDEDATFAAVVDAKIGGVYIQKAHMQGGIVTHLRGPELCALPHAVGFLNDVDVIVTPFAEVLRPKLEAACPGVAWSWQERYPSPQQLMRVAREKMNNKQFSVECHLNLLYMRKTQAEIEKEQRANVSEL